MPLDVKRFQQLKANVDRLQSEADRAEGALGQLMGRLKTEYNCDTEAAADVLSARVEAEVSAEEAAVGNDLALFEREWGEVLRG